MSSHKARWHKHATVGVVVLLFGILSLAFSTSEAPKAACRIPCIAVVELGPWSWKKPLRLRCDGRGQAVRGAAAVLLGMPVHLNSATATELAAIPGISRRLAHDIIKERGQNGAFPSFQALGTMHGIGPKRLQTLQKYTLVETPRSACEF